MSKKPARLLALICAVLLLGSIFSGLVFAAGKEKTEASDDYLEIPLYVEGIRVGSGLKITDTTYVPFRAFIESLGQEVTVTWNEGEKTITAEAPDLTITAQVGDQYIIANDRYFFAPNKILLIDDIVYAPIRSLAKAYNLEVIWNDEFKTIDIGEDDMTPAIPGDEFYNTEDLHWLAQIINAESGNQPLEGKIGVGNVVLNRVSDPTCPDSVYSVIFDRKYGVQFHVTTSNAIYAAPNAESIIAAKLCLEGYKTVGDSLYFVNPVIGTDTWFVNTRVYVATIGGHVFYS